MTQVTVRDIQDQDVNGILVPSSLFPSLGRFILGKASRQLAGTLAVLPRGPCDREDGLSQQPREGTTLEEGPAAPLQPADDCHPSQRLDKASITRAL